MDLRNYLIQQLGAATFATNTPSAKSYYIELFTCSEERVRQIAIELGVIKNG